MKKFIQILPFIIITIFSAILLFKLYEGKSDYNANSRVGSKIPNFNLKNVAQQNEDISNEILNGKYTILNFFSSWCVACKVEHPIFMELNKQIKNNKIQIIGVAWRDKKQDTKDWLKQNGNPYHLVLADNLGVFGIELGITGIPETFIVDENAKIIAHYRGDIKPEFLLELEELLKKIKIFNEEDIK